MVTDLVEVRRMAEARQAENLDFRRYLKAHRCPEEPFHILAGEVEKHIDCTQCANCCRELQVNVTAEEVDRIAAYLRIPSSEVVRLYTDRGDRRALRSTDSGCVFLDGNLCMIYDVRPRACREFPHSELHQRTLGGRMESQCRKASICPIIFNTLEEYKHRVGYHPRPH